MTAQSDDRDLRDPEDVEILTRGHARMRELITDRDIEDWDPSKLTADQCLAFSFLIMGGDNVRLTTWPPDKQRCGWCIEAGGDTDEAAKASVLYTLDDARAHASTCEHNPSVKAMRKMDAEVEKLAAKLEWLTAELAEYYPVAITARAMCSDEATEKDLREVIDVIGNGDLNVRLAHLSPRILKVIRG